MLAARTCERVRFKGSASRRLSGAYFTESSPGERMYAISLVPISLRPLESSYYATSLPLRLTSIVSFRANPPPLCVRIQGDGK